MLERERELEETTRKRREDINRVLEKGSVQSLDDSFEFAIVIVGAFLLGAQTIAPESFAVTSVFNLFTTLFIWALYRIAKIKNATDLRLLIIGLGYQLFVVWVVGIFLLIGIGSVIALFLTLVMPSFTLDLAVPVIMILTLAFSCGSRNAAKEYISNKWESMVSGEYKSLSIRNRYGNTALAPVQKVLPHGLAIFILFFLLYWIGDPSLSSSESGFATILFLLALYIIYKWGVYLTVQKEESSNW